MTLSPEFFDTEEFYRGQQVCVVGGAGMVGSKLVELLLQAGASVLVLDDFSRGTKIFPQVRYVLSDWLVGHKDVFNGYTIKKNPGIMEQYDGMDAGRWPYYVNAFANCRIVFNLAAAVAGVLHNEKSHLQMYSDNVRVLAGPLRAAEQAGVEHYLQTSSVCVYAEEHQSPCVEENGFLGKPHPANAGYAEAKRDGERMVRWSKIPHAVIVRPSNIVGERDYFDKLAHVVPAFIRRAVEIHRRSEGRFIAYGSGAIQREFIYSGDVASGMLVAMARGAHKEVYNIGTSGGASDKQNVITMRSLAHKIMDMVGYELGDQIFQDVMFDNTAGGGDSVRYSDASKLRSLGWRHKTDLYDILQKTIRYYLEVQNNGD